MSFRVVLFCCSLLVALTGCGTRSLTGAPVICGCSVPPFGRGGCGSGPSAVFTTWACVPPGGFGNVECNSACQSVAGIASGVALECTVGPTGAFEDVPIIRLPGPDEMPPCIAGDGSPLIASTGYLSSQWDFVPARSLVQLQNARDRRTLPIAAGRLSVYLPAGHTVAGPMSFEMLNVSQALGSSVLFDGHRIEGARISNAKPFPGEANPTFVTPPRPGQFNSYRIAPGQRITYGVRIDGTEISDVASNTNELRGVMYREPSPTVPGAYDSYFVYDGIYPVGEGANTATLTLHLEFKYGGAGATRPEPPVLTVTRKFGTDLVDLQTTITPPASSAPKVSYQYWWYAGKSLAQAGKPLSTSPNPVFKPSFVKDSWVTLVVQAEQAGVYRIVPVCLLSKGCQ